MLFTGQEVVSYQTNGEQIFTSSVSKMDIHLMVYITALCPEAPSKDAVRDVCVESHRGPSRRLTETTAAALSIPAAQAAQVTPLHVPGFGCLTVTVEDVRGGFSLIDYELSVRGKSIFYLL